MTPQRGAIPIDLDRRRILFYDAAATFLLTEKYGLAFATALYETVSGTGLLSVRLKSEEALIFFLWAGLARDAREHDEDFTLEDAALLVRPWTVRDIFAGIVRAISGATHVEPEAPTGKSSAASPAQPAARKSAAKKAAAKVSTLRLRSPSRSQR